LNNFLNKIADHAEPDRLRKIENKIIPIYCNFAEQIDFNLFKFPRSIATG